MTTMKPPRIGSIVVDSGGHEVGILVDIIGPVRSPYAVVRPLRDDVSVDPHSVLFVKPKPKRRRRVRK